MVQHDNLIKLIYSANSSIYFPDIKRVYLALPLTVLLIPIIILALAVLIV